MWNLKYRRKNLEVWKPVLCVGIILICLAKAIWNDGQLVTPSKHLCASKSFQAYESPKRILARATGNFVSYS